MTAPSHNPTPHAPRCSVILPTYNRAGFLAEAFGAIAAQTFDDFELVVIDDGSTDDTSAVLSELIAQLPQPVQVVQQANAGPYAARNRGLELAQGQYIAFYDSDDIWLPHHLQHCIDAMEAHGDVDWVYGACRMVDQASGALINASSFRDRGRPRQFMRLRNDKRDRLHVIQDHQAACVATTSGLYCGLQNSVIRRRVFDAVELDDTTRNEAEDQLFTIRALLAGFTLAWFDQVHVIYQVHASNSSAAANDAPLERRLNIEKLVCQGYERLLLKQLPGTAIHRAIRRRLGWEYFWITGYALLWLNGRVDDAMEAYQRGLAYWPYDPRAWKTYALAKLKRRWFKSLTPQPGATLTPGTPS